MLSDGAVIFAVFDFIVYLEEDIYDI